MADGAGRIYQDGGEALLEAARALAIDYVICSPGSEWAPAWEAFARQRANGTAGPIYIDVWHETLAVDLAAGVTLKSGRMQMVLLHAAPGLLQGACGIHAANLAGLPMLVLSSDADSYGERQGVDPGSQWYRNLSTVGGPQGLVDRFVKWSCQIPGIETMYEFVKRAGELSRRSPAGPVYLNAPVEVLLTAWSKPATAMNTAEPGRLICPGAEIDRLVARLHAAREPVILTESVGRKPAGFRALMRFAEAFAIPVIEPQSTICGNFPKHHPLYLGSEIGGLRDTTDLVLLINCRAPWYPPSNRPAQAATIVIDEVPQRPAAVYQVLFADQYLEGEVADTLDRAAALAGTDDAARTARRDRHAAAHAVLRARIAKAEQASAAADRLEAVHAIVRLRAAVPADTIYVDETITHSRLVQMHLQWSEPHSYFYVQGGLGQGIGVALGVKLAAGTRFVTLLLGDGAYLYNPVVQGLALARQQNLPVLIVILNNRRYLSMQLNHLRFYPDGMAKANDDFDGVRLDGQPQLEAFGVPYGMFTAAVTDTAALDQTLTDAVAAVRGGRTAIVNIHVVR